MQVTYNEFTRSVYFSTEVNDESAVGLCSIIDYINAMDVEENIPANKRKPIKLIINSPGGSVYSLWTILHAMENSVTPIDTYCSGLAASCAFKMFICGRKRYVGKRATLLCHQVSSGARGTCQDMRESMEELEHLEKQVWEFIKEHTNITQEKLDEISRTKKDWCITPSEAIKLGCADAYWGKH